VRELVLCRVMCVLVQVVGYNTVLSEVVLRYRVWEMLLCRVMCVPGTGRGKYYCVQ